MVDKQFEASYIKGQKIGEGMHSQVFQCYKITDKNKQFPYAVKITRDDDEEK